MKRVFIGLATCAGCVFPVDLGTHFADVATPHVDAGVEPREICASPFERKAYELDLQPAVLADPNCWEANLPDGGETLSAQRLTVAVLSVTQPLDMPMEVPASSGTRATMAVDGWAMTRLGDLTLPALPAALWGHSGRFEWTAREDTLTTRSTSRVLFEFNGSRSSGVMTVTASAECTEGRCARTCAIARRFEARRVTWPERWASLDPGVALVSLDVGALSRLSLSERMSCGEVLSERAVFRPDDRLLGVWNSLNDTVQLTTPVPLQWPDGTRGVLSGVIGRERPLRTTFELQAPERTGHLTLELALPPRRCGFFPQGALLANPVVATLRIHRTCEGSGCTAPTAECEVELPYFAVPALEE